MILYAEAAHNYWPHYQPGPCGTGRNFLGYETWSVQFPKSRESSSICARLKQDRAFIGTRLRPYLRANGTYVISISTIWTTVELALSVRILTKLSSKIRAHSASRLTRTERPCAAWLLYGRRIDRHYHHAFFSVSPLFALRSARRA